jgi:hypothetical protein
VADSALVDHGTHRPVQASAAAGGEALEEKDWTPAEGDAKRVLAKKLKLARHIQPGHHGPRWTPEQMALLGKLPSPANRQGNDGMST